MIPTEELRGDMEDVMSDLKGLLDSDMDKEEFVGRIMACSAKLNFIASVCVMTLKQLREMESLR